MFVDFCSYSIRISILARAELYRAAEYQPLQQVKFKQAKNYIYKLYVS